MSVAMLFASKYLEILRHFLFIKPYIEVKYSELLERRRITLK